MLNISFVIFVANPRRAWKQVKLGCGWKIEKDVVRSSTVSTSPEKSMDEKYSLLECELS